ncbi:hypothetical protein ISF_00980 [Cordyceps fumosorosea ARSEF 2679]|uniref:PH domain-containing protein n=1 Tax=Cordyceps fumosorosea (strain ARSEF 2679) TaxID=1081104 RepID=A0A162N1N0_CORFA|nr:hypothetical protein ISF_00980 [Cordyceps fumosorosea ARSEF 2679]OAA74079.1 hypothetical protein ISF_00980 [Cordyceps fumosorosea ARSEF 2679]
MATEVAAPTERPSSTSRYRMLRGKSVSAPRALDIFHDGRDKADGSPLSRPQTSSGHTSKAGTFGGAEEKSAAPPLPDDVPPLPSSYALAPKPVNIPLPPSPLPLKIVKQQKPAQVRAVEDDAAKRSTETPLGEEEPPMTPLQQVKSKLSKGLIFGAGGKKEQQETTEPLPGVETMQTEVQRKIAEQKRQDLARLQATLLTTTPTLKPKTSLFSLFSRGRKSSTPTPSASSPITAAPDTPSSLATTVFSSRGNSLETTESAKFSDQLCQGMPYTPERATPPVIRTSSQTFERLEHVNADVEFQRVAVRCQSSTINLAVSNETTAVDILDMASAMTRHRIDPASSVVVESYLVLGLERRLRRYERVRDVMNTWDSDHENSLLVLSCPTASSSAALAAGSSGDSDLDIDPVADSAEPPAGFHNLELHLSSRPGKWSKRWITLKDNGQMYSAKTEDAQPGEDDDDADCMPLCHLSDFDIYSPKEIEVRQSVRPPKRLCYALKSQQRSAQVADEADFVHFIATDSEEMAARFYEAVHHWRSWLLATRKLALDRKMSAPAPRISFQNPPPTAAPPAAVTPAAAPPTAAAATKAESSEAAADKPRFLNRDPSSGAVFKIGSFEPLLDMDNIEQLAAEARKRMPVELPKPAVVEEQKDAIPPTPDRPPPATPGSKAKNQAKSSHDSSPTSVYRISPGPAPSDSVPSPPLSRSGSFGIDSLVFDDFPDAKPEPKSWFPSAAEHTAKLRKDLPPPPPPAPPSPPMFRRPGTADAATPLHPHHNQRRAANGLPPIDTRFLEPPRPFEYFGIPPPKPGGAGPPMYRGPGGPRAGRPMPRPLINPMGSGEMGPGGARARSRSNAANSGRVPGGRPMVPPVPSVANRSMARDAPSQAPSVPLPVHPPYQPQRGMPAAQPVSQR